MYNFEGKIAAVTGAAQGIGLATAQRLYEEGADCVVMLDLKEDQVKTAAAEMDPEGKRTLALACNVGDWNSVEAAFTQALEKLGRIDILVNNAGITRDAMCWKMTPEQFDQCVKVSLYGAFYCSRMVIPGMREREYGRIISLSSLAHAGNVGQTNYSAAKAGIVGMTKTMALELGNKNITVNCLAPGMTNTDIIKTVPENIQEQMRNRIPMKRFGEVEDVVNLIAFLASDQAGYISGQVVTIAGGVIAL